MNWDGWGCTIFWGPRHFFGGGKFGERKHNSPAKKVESSRSPIMMVVADIMGRHERRKERLFFSWHTSVPFPETPIPPFSSINLSFLLSLSLSLARANTGLMPKENRGDRAFSFWKCSLLLLGRGGPGRARRDFCRQRSSGHETVLLLLLLLLLNRIFYLGPYRVLRNLFKCRPP